MGKHSPGPWRTGPINYADVYDADGELVALIIKGKQFTVQDAQLVAACPDLLKSLKRMATVADHHGSDGPEFFDARNSALALIEKIERFS